MTPPTTIDGTEITGATIDGQEVTEITVDGQRVFTSGLSLPASTIAHFDAGALGLSNNATVNNFTDQVGNNDLDQVNGAPVLKTSGIAGLPAVDFDGVDDFLTTDTSRPLNPQPNVFFMVLRDRGTNRGLFLSGRTNDNRQDFQIFESEGFTLFAGNGLNTFQRDTNPHIFTCIFDGASSELRIDGTSFTGDVGTDPLKGFTMGAFASGSFAANALIAEAIVCNARVSTADIQTLESELSEKYGISI